MKPSTFLLLALPILVIACSKHGDDGATVAAPAQQTGAKSLDGLAAQELLRAKYDRLLMFCRLELGVDQYEGGDHWNNSDNEGLQFDLLEDIELPHSYP